MRWFLIICVLVTGLHSSPDAHADEITELRALADQGHVDAQFNLGIMYSIGKGVVQDYKQALFWYRKAADQGLSSAQCNLGVMYNDSRGVVQDSLQRFDVRW